MSSSGSGVQTRSQSKHTEERDPLATSSRKRHHRGTASDNEEEPQVAPTGKHASTKRAKTAMALADIPESKRSKPSETKVDEEKVAAPAAATDGEKTKSKKAPAKVFKERPTSHDAYLRKMSKEMDKRFGLRGGVVITLGQLMKETRRGMLAQIESNVKGGGTKTISVDDVIHAMSWDKHPECPVGSRAFVDAALGRFRASVAADQPDKDKKKKSKKASTKDQESKEETKESKPKVSGASRAGLLFPPSFEKNLMKLTHPELHVGREAPVAMAAALESLFRYMLKKCMNAILAVAPIHRKDPAKKAKAIAARKAKQSRNRKIGMAHLSDAINLDATLQKLYGSYYIRGVSNLPADARPNRRLITVRKTATTRKRAKKDDEPKKKSTKKASTKKKKATSKKKKSTTKASKKSGDKKKTKTSKKSSSKPKTKKRKRSQKEEEEEEEVEEASSSSSEGEDAEEEEAEASGSE